MNRGGWCKYFMEIALAVSSRSTCPRKSVGCVITTPDRRIVATGYNGSLAGTPHCIEQGCLMIEVNYQPEASVSVMVDPDQPAKLHAFIRPGNDLVMHCRRAVHAETNALLQCARHGIAVNGAIAYVTTSPCLACMTNLCAAGIKTIVYGDAYRLDLSLPIAQAAGVGLIHAADYNI